MAPQQRGFYHIFKLSRRAWGASDVGFTPSVMKQGSRQKKVRLLTQALCSVQIVRMQTDSGSLTGTTVRTATNGATSVGPALTFVTCETLEVCLVGKS
jgi:hypothetical protein